MQNKSGQADFVIILGIVGAIVGGILGFKIGGYGGILSGILIGPAILIPFAGLIAAGLEALAFILIGILAVLGVIYYLWLTYTFWGVGKEDKKPVLERPVITTSTALQMGGTSTSLNSLQETASQTPTAKEGLLKAEAEIYPSGNKVATSSLGNLISKDTINGIWVIVKKFILGLLLIAIIYQISLEISIFIGSDTFPFKFLTGLLDASRCLITFFVFFLVVGILISPSKEWGGVFFFLVVCAYGGLEGAIKERLRIWNWKTDSLTSDVPENKIESLSLIKQFHCDSSSEVKVFPSEVVVDKMRTFDDDTENKKNYPKKTTDLVVSDKQVEKKEKIDKNNCDENSLCSTIEPPICDAKNFPLEMERTLKLSESEKDYLEEVTALAIDGKLNEKALEILERRQKKLGLRDDQCQNLRTSVCPNFLSFAEKEYIEEFRFFIADDKKIDDTERKSLNRIRKKLGLTLGRCKELENLEMQCHQKLLPL
ncbi:MAG: hypothetical protein HQM08_28095 [Candidatus Riflebacteria bacterium]|nr:hypothetical protein [Candidatus Riflebacteria bacterium]